MFGDYYKDPYEPIRISWNVMSGFNLPLLNYLPFLFNYQRINPSWCLVNLPPPIFFKGILNEGVSFDKAGY